MNNFESLKRHYYQQVAASPDWKNPYRDSPASDIVLHLPVLEYFASLCDEVVEFGVREGNSTVALLAGAKRRVRSYDIEETRIVSVLRSMALPCSWEFQVTDTANPSLDIGEADFIFFDTLHTYDHLKKELQLHASKARRFLAFHDTFTCGEFDRSGPNPNAKGILPAIQEFLSAHHPKSYKTVYRTTVNNGLWILEKSSPA